MRGFNKKKMERKAQSTIAVIFVIIFILAIIGLAVYLSITYKDKIINQQPETKTTKLLIKVVDAYDQISLESNLCIFKNKFFNECHKTSSLAWTELNLEIKQNYTFYMNKSGYYSDIFEIENLYELYPNTEIPLKKIGNLEVSHTNQLKEDVADVFIDLDFIDTFKRLQVCTTWSKGLIYARIELYPLTCNRGWVNCTKYERVYEKNRLVNKCVIPIPEGKYYCQELDRFELCENIQGNACYPEKIEPPKRLEKLVNSCTYIGRDFYNEKFLLKLQTKGYLLDSTDYVKIYLIDSDLILQENNFIYSSELNRIDIGKEDIVYTIQNV